LLTPLEHQHLALIEATIERVLHARLERVDTMAYKAARESYRGRWLTVALVELLGVRMPANPGQAAVDRASQLNTESYRKARASLGESEMGGRRHRGSQLRPFDLMRSAVVAGARYGGARKSRCVGARAYEGTREPKPITKRILSSLCAHLVAT
jgi:hypothetical protein